MKINKKQKKLIKEAYNASYVCQDWKDKIKEAFPKLFKETKLEVDRWYRDYDGDVYYVKE